MQCGPNKAYFPAISLERGQKAIFNFGLSPFNLRTPFMLVAVNEPDSMVNNFFSSSNFLVERLKNYALAYHDSKFSKLSEDERVFVGSVIVQYLIPLMEEPYVLELQILSFLHDMTLIKRKDLFNCVLKTFELCFN